VNIFLVKGNRTRIMIRLLIGGSGTLNDSGEVLLLYQDLMEIISLEQFDVK